LCSQESSSRRSSRRHCSGGLARLATASGARWRAADRFQFLADHAGQHCDPGRAAAVELAEQLAHAGLHFLAAVLAAAGIRIIKTPVRAPRANAVCERMVGTLRRESLDRLLIVNEDHLRRVLTEYLKHYNTARPHRALGQMPPAQAHARPPQIDLAEHRIRRKQVLGGLTHEYQIAA
jgi:transposase InsO family protein